MMTFKYAFKLSLALFIFCIMQVSSKFQLSTKFILLINVKNGTIVADIGNGSMLLPGRYGNVLQDSRENSTTFDQLWQEQDLVTMQVFMIRHITRNVTAIGVC